MSAKAKGTRGEHQRKHLLEAAGYGVFRMAGSHGLFDLIAVSPTDLLCVQLKSRDWPSSLEREQLEAFRVPVNCGKLAHRWRNGARQPDVLEIPA